MEPDGRSLNVVAMRLHRPRAFLGFIACLFYCFCLWWFVRHVLDRTYMEIHIPWGWAPLNWKPQESQLDLLDLIQLNCSFDNFNKQESEKLKRWNYTAVHEIEAKLVQSADRCSTIKELFYFSAFPMSQEEEKYPLAYGIIVYKNIVQVLFMLSSFYHPQNQYVFAVSNTASADFKKIIGSLPECFNNVQVLFRPGITWGSFEIINSLFACIEYLSKLHSPWKYFQYLSGTDIPLKTNWEMVHIFKSLNKTVNAEYVPYQVHRLGKKNESNSPLPLFKSSMSALLPRETIDQIVNRKVTRKLLEFLNNTSIPDESFWGTLTGNKRVFPVFGSIEALELFEFRQKFRTLLAERNESSIGIVGRYYLSRLQIWPGIYCRGKFISGSCVFGVDSIGQLMSEPHLVAHKLYLDYEPAAFFCMLKEIRKRTQNPSFEFDTTLYEELPQVEMKRGIPMENLTHPNWFL